VHLAETLVLPAAPLTVARLLADPDLARDAISASGAVCEHVAVVGDADGPFTVTTLRALPAEQVPAAVRGFVGSRLQVRQVEMWDAPDDEHARAGTVTVEVVGAPVRLDARGTLVAHGPLVVHGGAADATAVRYDGELRAAVPLFGAVVEQTVAQAVREALVALDRAVRARLA